MKRSHPFDSTKGLSERCVSRHDGGTPEHRQKRIAEQCQKAWEVQSYPPRTWRGIKWDAEEDLAGKQPPLQQHPEEGQEDRDLQ